MRLFDADPKPDGGVFPCTCADHGDYCIMDGQGLNSMWPEYHCVLRVRGVLYKRDEDGNVIKNTTGKPSRSPIRRN